MGMLEHEDVLVAALCAPAGLEPAAVRAHLEACAECRLRLQTLREVEATLAEARAEERAVLAQAVGESPAPQGRATEVRLPVRPPALRRRPSGLRPVLALCAAAALLVALWLFLGRRPDPGPVYLGPAGAPRLLHPVGLVEEYAPFAWDHELGSGQSFELELIDIGGTEPRPLSSLTHLRTNAWTPPPELELDTIPRLRWILTVVGSTGEALESDAAEAWLEPR
jgi:hypothetical protein